MGIIRAILNLPWAIVVETVCEFRGHDAPDGWHCRRCGWTLR